MNNDNQPSESQQQGRSKTKVPQQTQNEILHLHDCNYGTRQIAHRVGYSRKIVRRILTEQGRLSPTQPTSKPSKLDSFRPIIDQKVNKGITTTRILREIRAQGYTGGRTILAEYVHTLHSRLSVPPRKTVKRRFETPAGKEMQIDWSVYRLPCGHAIMTVHILGCLLCNSRKLWAHAYRNERQATLLEGLASAFEYFQGCTIEVVLDNMATAVLAHRGPDGSPLWHPVFLDFARHYGFQPFACAVRDPDRKGKKEKSFRLIWDDFLKASEFDSLDDLNRQLKIWLDDTPDVANQRIHGTTRLVPNQQWLTEKQFLIQLPDKRFPAYDQSVRVVDDDATISIAGTRYTVPSTLASRSVAVRLFAEHFEVLDSHQRIVFSRAYVSEADKGKLIIDPTHYATDKRLSRSYSGQRLEDALL